MALFNPLESVTKTSASSRKDFIKPFRFLADGVGLVLPGIVQPGDLLVGILLVSNIATIHCSNHRRREGPRLKHFVILMTININDYNYGYYP
jgi:hypothetical protein